MGVDFYLVIIHGPRGSLDWIKDSVVDHRVHREGHRVRGQDLLRRNLEHFCPDINYLRLLQEGQNEDKSRASYCCLIVNISLIGNSPSHSDRVQGGAKHHGPLVLLAPLQDEEERERRGEDDQQERADMEETCDEPASPGPGGPLSNNYSQVVTNGWLCCLHVIPQTPQV